MLDAALRVVMIRYRVSFRVVRVSRRTRFVAKKNDGRYGSTCGVRYACVATKSEREDGGDGARCLLIRSATRRDMRRGRVSETFRLFIASARNRGRKRRLLRVSETFPPRASLETYRHGPASVPREDPAHALGHRLARPEVLLDAGPGRLSRARDAPSADDAEAAATAAALGDAVLPENATEALAAARHAWKAPGAVPPSLKETLSDPKLDALDKNAPSFWFLLAGLRAFLRGDGGDEASKLAALPSDAVMPLEGSIPDMTSTTEWYVELQRLYREKADADADAVLRHTRFFLRAAGASEEAVTREEARFFCRHAAHARAVRWRSVADELAWADGAGAALAAKLADPDATVAWCAARYVVARAVDVYRETRGRYPGAPLFVEKNDAHMMRDDAHPDGGDVCDVEGDTRALRSIVETTLVAIGAKAERVNGGALESMVTEAVRCAGGEPHTVAAVLGGVGAQEVIKLVTGQFEPEAHTLVYDAAKAVTAAVL